MTAHVRVVHARADRARRSRARSRGGARARDEPAALSDRARGSTRRLDASRALKPGSHRVEGFDVVAFDVPHKGGRTFGYRITDGRRVRSRTSPTTARSPTTTPAIARECAGVDLLVHDAQFLEPERAVADLYGHATVDDALELAERCGARRLALFHHSPGPPRRRRRHHRARRRSRPAPGSGGRRRDRRPRGRRDRPRL